MAYPYQITDQAFLPDPMYTPGPYEHNGNIYVALQSHPTGTANDKVRVYVSLDEGVSSPWAELDSANAKPFYQSNTSSPVDTFRLGSKFYITYVPQGGAPGATALDIAEFDMATGLWGTVITGGPIPGDDLRFKSFKLSTGAIRTVYSDFTGASRRRVSIAEYDGSWGSPTILFNPGVSESPTLDYYLQGAAIDADDNIGIVCDTNTSSASVGSLRYRHYSAAGVAGTFIRTSVKATIAIPPKSGWPAVIPLTGGGSRFAFPGWGQITNSGFLFGVPGVVIVEPGAAPTSFNFETVLDQSSLDLGSGFASPLYVASQSALFLYWAYFDGTSQYKIKRACSKLLAGWTAPVDVFVPSVDRAIFALCAQVVNTSKVGIVFSSWADGASSGPNFSYKFPQYYQEDLPTCGAVGCGASQSPIYRVT